MKVNADMGNSPTTPVLGEELGKLPGAERWGADQVTDLSTGNGMDETREAIVEAAAPPNRGGCCSIRRSSASNT